MKIDLLLPHPRLVDLQEATALVRRCQTTTPFDQSVVEACDSLSNRLRNDSEARRYPELLALAFWIRKAEIRRLKAQFDAMSAPDRILVPCGTVFHLPPRNVDTMFVYSWLLSALTGNSNVVRLSASRSAATDVLLRLFRESLAASGEPVCNSTLVVSYGHEQEPTAAFTRLCDVRVIWGGDQTVNTIRLTPVPSHAHDLSFPNRYSFAAIRTETYLALRESERDDLAGRFYNDAFWFDQLACSSPRAVLWCGPSSDGKVASADFFQRVSDVARRRKYVPDPATSMQKFVFSAESVLNLPIVAYRRWPEITVLTLESLAGFDRAHPGGGIFFEIYIDSLADMVQTLERQDQTLAVFGFDEAELRAFIKLLNGRAIDRIVPIGKALQFGRFWDGHDLLLEFCRQVHFDNTPPLSVGEARH